MMTTSLVGVGGCIEPYGGSNVQIDFHETVPTAARPGDTPTPNQPPADTHMVLWGTDFAYQVNADGVPVLDDAGNKTVERAFVYKVHEFELVPVIDPASPCFIDLEATRYPGLHVTRYAERLKADVGIDDPFEDGLDPGDVIDVLTAERRMDLLPSLASDLKAVTSYSPYKYPPIAADCGDPNAIPPARCIADADNAVRLRLCRAAWTEAGPGFYEGSDRIFILPLSGVLFGLVEGSNPINGGPVGGSGVYVETNLASIDAYMINWEYDDPAADPAGAARSATGYHFMGGTPERYSRGVINASMINDNDGNISADLSIFADLGTDNVHF